MPKLSIEALLVWTYREQRADHWWSSHQGLMPGEISLQTRGGPSLAKSFDGAMVRDEDQSWLSKCLVPWQIDDDAKAVHELVLRLPSKAMQTAVVMAGRRGRRPDLLATPRFVATEDLHPATAAEVETWLGYTRGPRRGQLWRFAAAAAEARRLEAKLGTLLAPTVSHPRSKRPSLCELRIDPDPRDWLAARASYETWRSALELLAWFLRQRGLRRHEVAETLPPPPPPVPSFVAYFVARAGESHLDGQPLGPAGFVPDDLDWSMVGVKGRRWTRTLAAPPPRPPVNAERR